MTTKEALYKLLRIAIGNDEDLSLPDGVNTLEVIDLSEKVGINGLAVAGMQRLVDNGVSVALEADEDKQRMVSWIGLSMMMEQKAKMQWAATQKLVGLYARHGITTVGLKGMTVAQWYPNPMHRDSCDFDCYLIGEHEDVWELGNKIVEDKGVKVDRNIYVHSVFEYRGLVVENHHYLAAVKLSKRHRRMDELLRKLLTEEPLQQVMDSQLMMGSPMFNAVFLTHHAHRHFLNEYMPLKLLCDWALFLKNNPSLDWATYWKYVDEFGMLRFAQTMTRLARELLGVNVAFELSEDEEADKMLEESIWDLPDETHGGKSLFERRLGIIMKLMCARKRYKVFYDCSSFQMIAAYVKGYLFGEAD